MRHVRYIFRFLVSGVSFDPANEPARSLGTLGFRHEGVFYPVQRDADESYACWVFSTEQAVKDAMDDRNKNFGFMSENLVFTSADEAPKEAWHPAA